MARAMSRRPRVAVSIVVGAVFTLWIFLFARVERSTLAERSNLHDDSTDASAVGSGGVFVTSSIPSVDARVVGAPPPPPPDRDAVTFVLVANSNPNNGPRAVALLASMRTFLRGDGAVRALLVVVPDRELDWWRLAARAVDASDFDLDVVGESRALATPVATLRAAAPETAARESRGVGYRIQMLLKIGVAALVRTEFYVTFDCDVVLAKPLTLGILVRDGKGALQGAMGGPHARRWISHSRDVMFGPKPGAADKKDAKDAKDEKKDERDACGVDRLSRTMGVTPAVLSTRAARATMSRLERVSNDGERWDAYLFRALEGGLDWTEYGVYAAGTCLEGLMDEVHFADPHVRLYDAALQEDGSKFKDGAAMARAFAGKKGSGAGSGDDAPVFAVLQSIGGSDAMEAATALYPHLVDG